MGMSIISMSMYISFGIIVAAVIIGVIAGCVQNSRKKQAQQEHFSPQSSGVKYCSSCGASMPTDSIFCPRCGRRA